MKWRQAGLSWLEFALVAVILVICAAVLLNRLSYYQEVAEKTNMEATVRALQSGLRFQMARELMAGKEIDYARLARENPMEWLVHRPSDYRGEVGNESEIPERSGWYFVRASCELAYVPRLDTHLTARDGAPARLRFQIELVKGHNGTQIVSARVRATKPYVWF